MHTYCINLEHRTDRRNEARREFDREGVDVEFFRATNGRKESPSGLYISEPEYGCAMSHVRVWRDVIEKGYDIALVTEDDVRLVPNFKTKLEEFKNDNNLINLFESWFDWHLLEKTYLEKADIQWYLQNRYRLVQKANEFITKAEPWKKYKDDITKDEAISDLQFLLYIVKNLALLSSPILVNWFKKIQGIFWNEELNKIDTVKNTQDSHLLKEVFDLDSFEVNLNPQIIYIKKE